MEEEKLPARLSRVTIYKSRWVNLFRDKVKLPTGNILEQYHLLDFGPGSVTVVVENERGEILMERISRYPTGLTTWELPAGGIEQSESPLKAAEREVFEETGYETHDHAEIYQFHPLTGISNLIAHVIRCKVGKQSGKLDPDEITSIQWFSPQELHAMIQRKEIDDGFTLIGLFTHFGNE